jgi:hypothetical protein
MSNKKRTTFFYQTYSYTSARLLREGVDVAQDPRLLCHGITGKDINAVPVAIAAHSQVFAVWTRALPDAPQMLEDEAPFEICPSDRRSWQFLVSSCT